MSRHRWSRHQAALAGIATGRKELSSRAGRSPEGEYLPHSGLMAKDRTRPRTRLSVDRTHMAAEQFDTLTAFLNVPDDTQNLARAFGRERRFIQR